MAFPYRPKFQSPKKPNSPSFSRIHNLKENTNNTNHYSEATRSEDRSSSLKKAMKKSYASPTFSASSKAKKAPSDRQDPSSWKPTWDKIPVTPHSSAIAPSVVTEALAVAKDKEIKKRDVMEVERTPEPPTLEELQRKVKKFLEEHTPQRRAENSVNSILSEEKQSGLPPYDPKKNYLSPRPQFLRYRPDRNLDFILNGDSPGKSQLEFDRDQVEEFGGLDEGVSKYEGVGINGLHLEDVSTENRPWVEDFSDNKPQQESELQSLERQMASVDISTGLACEGNEGFAEDKQLRGDETCQITDQYCNDRQHEMDLVPEEDTIVCSSISNEANRVEEAVTRLDTSIVKPKSGSVVEVEESCDDDEMEEARKWVRFAKNCLVLIFAVVSVLVAILASGSPALLPSSLHGNPLATSWLSSKLHGPTMKVLRGAEGLWSSPMYCDVNLKALQKHGQSGLRMRTTGFWLSTKEFCVDNFNKLEVGTEKLPRSFVSDISMPDSFNKPSDAEDSGSAMVSHDENPEVPEKGFTPRLPFDSSQFVHSDGAEYGYDNFNKLEVGTEKLPRSFVSDISMPGSFNEPSDAEDSGSAMVSHDENPEIPEKGFRPRLPFDSSQFVHSDGAEYGYDAEFNSMQYSPNEPSPVDDSVSMLELHDENPSYSHASLAKSSLPIPPSGLNESVQSNEAHYGHEVDYVHDHFRDGSGADYGHNEADHNYEPSALSSETEGQEDADRFDGLFSPSQEYTEVPRSFEIGFSWPEEIDAGTEGFDIIYGKEQKVAAEYQQVMEVSVDAENTQVLESVILDSVHDIGNLPVDAEKNVNSSEDSIPELVSIMDIGADVSHESESHFGNSGSHDFVFSSSETETNSEIQSFEANTEAVPFESLFIQDPEELSTSSGGGDYYIPAMASQSKTLNFESQNEFEFRHNESVMSLVEKSSREGGSDISVVHDLGDSSTPAKSLKYILLFGTIGASIFAVAMLATYLVSVYRKSAKCTSPKRTQEHDQNTVAEKNGPTEDAHSIPRREILYPQRNHFSSMQMTVPCENNFEPRDSYVPKVELLNEYLPSKVVNTSERKVNTWLLSSTQENSFHTPERKVRRSNTYSETEQGSMATQEMSMDDSPSYGSFTTLMKEGSSEEQMKVTPVRRSNRLRNQKKSPLSAVRTISK